MEDWQLSRNRRRLCALWVPRMSGSAFRLMPASAVEGEIIVPGDKSISHRALMLAGIAHGRTVIDGFLEGEDCLATLHALQALGVSVKRRGPGRVVIEGVGLHGLRAPSDVLDMGNSGTA